MRYANLHQIKVSFESSPTVLLNIGDPLQMLVVQGLYDELGLPEDQIVRLRLEEMPTYDGEPLALPVNFGLIYKYYYVNGRITISDKIRPIFLAATLAAIHDGPYRDTLFNDPANLDYLRRVGPIGCRDEYTLLRLREHGLPAYLNGCLTATLPRRDPEKASRADQVYFVDAPESLADYIPRPLFDNCVFLSQQSYVPAETLKDTPRINALVRERYDEYRDRAALVVTSRLHVASPCLAMGIPVILAMDVPDHRYGWLEKLTPLYTPATYGDIQWNPQAPEYEDVKADLRELARRRILGRTDTETLQARVGAFFEERPRASYIFGKQALHENTEVLDRFASRHWNDGRPVRYALWGLTESADLWRRHIEARYPFARLETVIDNYKDETFHGLRPQKQDVLTADEDLYVIVIAAGAAAAARELFAKINKPQRFYCLAAETFLSGVPAAG